MIFVRFVSIFISGSFIEGIRFFVKLIELLYSVSAISGKILMPIPPNLGGKLSNFLSSSVQRWPPVMLGKQIMTNYFFNGVCICLEAFNGSDVISACVLEPCNISCIKQLEVRSRLFQTIDGFV